MRKELGHVKANAARSDDRDALTHGLLVAQYVDVAEDFVVLNAGQLQLSRLHARGQIGVRQPLVDVVVAVLYLLAAQVEDAILVVAVGVSVQVVIEAVPADLVEDAVSTSLSAV